MGILSGGAFRGPGPHLAACAADVRFALPVNSVRSAAASVSSFGRLRGDMALDPLADIPIPAEIARLPKADIHIHPEWSPRLDRVLAKRQGRKPYDWRAWARRLMKSEAPGGDRLQHLSKPFPELIEADKRSGQFHRAYR